MGLPWSFATWSMAVIGPIEAAANGHRFILEAIDYFTVEPSTYKAMTKKVQDYSSKFHCLSAVDEWKVEAANKNIKKILRKIVNSHKQWHEKLPYAFLGYRTMIRTSYAKSLYMLVYGSEVVIPAEIEIPSLRIIQQVGLDDAE
ncbi:uncharacterized protein LOC107006375 [Solanum pennellii]|uniref:Uncharacterized protein LOC107006375 n=1 Tax=Solanum pennellii TaxID=28526 RepID=A0ABM1FQX9_SOLPN|nr:uncharacterized protein LOC107006375 [Solanum pennellii]